MEAKFRAGVLFGGTTADGFRLGTVLSRGWFWFRVGGCSVLYRGRTMVDIDFGDILAVSDVGAEQISPPMYVSHDAGANYFYVVRRVSGCGVEERSLSAAAKVSIGDDGELAEAEPNDIFDVRIRQVEGSRAELLWYYCPIGQGSEPVCFKVYGDNGTGQIDFQNPLAEVLYIGRVFYSYLSEPLEEGRYLFAIRAEDKFGVQGGSLANAGIEVAAASPAGVDIEKVEVI